MKFISQIFILAIASLVVASPGRYATKDQPEETSEASGGDVVPSARAQFVMPKLYDFAAYRQKYNKNYEDSAELAGRTKLYIARVCTIFMSSLMYKRGLSSKYLKIGPFTDWTNEERGIAEKNLPVRALASTSEITSRESPQTSLTGQSSYERQVNLSEEGQAEARSSIRPIKRRNKVKSFMKSIMTAVTCSHGGGRLEKTPNRRNEIGQSSGYQPYLGVLRDTVIRDYRETGCFAPIKNQGPCASCYAFAALALVEYHNCEETNNKVLLSEQYLVDCGYRQSPFLGGCEGGAVKDAVDFLLSYGVERLAHYEYRAKDQDCPYKDSTHPRQMGSSRIVGAQAGYSTLTHRDNIEKLLDEHGPIYIELVIGSDFHDFGGGVDVLYDCGADSFSNHVVAIVGFGVESGLEYWLIRNSHGIEFGEEGHYKLGKNSDVNCIKGIGYIKGKLDDNRRYVGEQLLKELAMG